MKKRLLPTILFLSGCATLQPLSKGTTLILSPRIEAGKYTHTEMLPFTKSSVNHLVLELYPLVGGVPQDRLLRKVLLNAQLDNQIVISALKAQTSYRICPYAYASADESQLISRSDANFYTDITVGNENSPTLAPFTVTLLDQVFNGQATASGMDITPGGYDVTGSEALLPYAQPIMLVTTLAGGGTTTGFSEGMGDWAKFSDAAGMAFDGNGNLYVADSGNNRVRKITPSGIVSTFAGNGTNGYSGEGNATEVRFSNPYGLAFDKDWNLYVSEAGTYRIRKITPGGMTSTYAGGNGQGSTDGSSYPQLSYPRGIAFDASGSLYVADNGIYKIRKIAPDGSISTFAGNGTSGSVDGTGSGAQLKNPYGVTCDSHGNVYVGDQSYRVRKITPEGVVSTFAGNGTSGYRDGIGSNAQFAYFDALVCDGNDNLFIVDEYNYRIRKVTSDGVVTTLAGYGNSGTADGLASNAQFYYPNGITYDSQGNLYVSEQAEIRKLRWLNAP